MMKSFAIFVLAAAAGLAGCYSAIALSPPGRDVQLMKSDPPTGCREVGPVSIEQSHVGADDAVTAIESGKNGMRNQAAGMGANYVRWETSSRDPNTKTQIDTGTAFQCPLPADGSPASAAPSTP